MDFHGIKMQGPVWVQRVSSLPTWTSDDEGRLICNISDGKLYIGTDSEWKEVGAETKILQSDNWSTDEGILINLNNGTAKFGGSSSPKLNWDGTELSFEGVANVTGGNWSHSNDGSKIDGSKIYPGTVKAAQLSHSESVITQTDQISDEIITTPKIADASVTSYKLADDSVTTPKIADASVTSDKLADNSVTASKLASGALSIEKAYSTSYTHFNYAHWGTIQTLSVTWKGGKILLLAGAKIFASVSNVTGHLSFRLYNSTDDKVVWESGSISFGSMSGGQYKDVVCFACVDVPTGSPNRNITYKFQGSINAEELYADHRYIVKLEG